LGLVSKVNGEGWFSGHGGKKVFLKVLGHGNKVITHAAWTLEYARDHHH